MPRLPAPEDYGVSVPRASRGVTEITPAQRRPDLLTGKVLGDIGLMMEQEAEKIDDALAQDALNQLQDQQLDLTYGEQGFTKLEGTQVTDRPVVQEYSDKMRITTEGLAAKISSPRVKQKFQLAAADVNRGFKQKLAIHTTGQVEKIKEQAFFGGAATAQRMAGEGDLEGAVAYMAPLIGAAVAERGLTGDAATAFARETMGAVYSANISKLLESDQPLEAKAILEANKGLMTDKQVAGFSKQIKSDVAWVRGDDMVRTMLAEGKTTAEVEAAVSAEAKKTGDKSFYDSAYHTLGNITAVRTKTYAENADKAQDEINRGKPWSRLREKYLDSMDPSVVAAFDQRAKALAKEGSVKTDFDAYYTLSVMPPEQFAKVDLRTYSGKLSEGNLRTLADRQGKIINKDEKEIRDTVTLQQQLGIAHAELGFSNTASARKKKGMFDAYVVDTVSAQEKVKGKPLTDDERKTVIQRAMIAKDTSWWQSDKLYYEVAGTPEAEKFVPEIPAADRAAILAVFARKGVKPTEQDIIQKYKTANGLK
jgi:hypothetical protein